MRNPVLALMCALAVVGCDSVSSENIQKWKGTQKGPGKLQAALKDTSVPAPLRAEAAVALVEIGMADEVDIALAGASPAERWEIGKALVPLYQKRMGEPDVEKARTARDGLFSVRGHAPPAEQAQIDAVILASIEADLRAGRTTGGRHSMEKMLGAIGPAAAPMLVRLLEDPKVPFMGVADLLVRVGDQAARERGGAALVKRASLLPEIPVPLWRTLGQLGGKPVVDFLVAKVEMGSEKDAVAAAQALQQRREPAVLGVALRIAGDTRANKAVRDELFGLVEKIGGPEAQRGMVQIIASDPEEMVRYRAYEAALAAGGPGAVVPALEALPAKASYKREDVVDFLVKDITKLGPLAKDSLVKALASTSPLARMAGVLAFETDLGAAADAPVLLKLAGDRGTVKGFPAGATVGSEAARVAAVLGKRR